MYIHVCTCIYVHVHEAYSMCLKIHAHVHVHRHSIDYSKPPVYLHKLALINDLINVFHNEINMYSVHVHVCTRTCILDYILCSDLSVFTQTCRKG